MPIDDPVIKQSAANTCFGIVGEGIWPYAFLVTEGNLYRAREVITSPKGTELHPGDFVTATGTRAATAAAIIGIATHYSNACDGPIDINVVVRDCEVADAYLLYGALDPAAVNARLASTYDGMGRIIVRMGVLPNTMQGGFGTPGQPMEGGLVTGIPYPEPDDNGGSGSITSSGADNVEPASTRQRGAAHGAAAQPHQPPHRGE